MASGEEAQIMGAVRTQDMSVSWVSGPGIRNENTDRICILTMANGQIRLTMQSSTINLKGMRLTKGHICVFALFEAYERGEKDAAAADKASEMFISTVMKYDITKKPAAPVIRKCLSKADKAVKKEFRDARYKASVAAFAAKDLTVCSVNGGRMFILSDDGNMKEFRAEGMDVTSIGTSWKNVMMASGGFPVSSDDAEDDMRSPIGDIITKKGMKELPDPSSMIRAQKI